MGFISRSTRNSPTIWSNIMNFGCSYSLFCIERCEMTGHWYSKEAPFGFTRIVPQQLLSPLSTLELTNRHKCFPLHVPKWSIHVNLSEIPSQEWRANIVNSTDSSSRGFTVEIVLCIVSLVMGMNGTNIGKHLKIYGKYTWKTLSNFITTQLSYRRIAAFIVSKFTKYVFKAMAPQQNWWQELPHSVDWPR